jgi:acyl carrier protein phosphodiesterase
MNYLAHALLSPEDPLILMGNLWGDLLKPKDYEALDPVIVRGVLRHKSIDAYTDQHHAVDQMVRLIRPYQGKYTPVVADVLMDYILSKHWERYHPQPIEEFCRLTYERVAEHLALIPDRLHPRIQRMLSHQWLESCKNRERMEQTLLMLSKRAAFDNNIPDALIPYDLHDQVMDELFVDFFADIQQYISLQNAG